MSSTPTTIFECASKQLVDAELLDGLVPEDLMLLESVWTPERTRILLEINRAGLNFEERPQSLTWNWRAKAHHLKLSQAAAYAVVCEEEFQGAMLTKAGTHFARLDGDRGRPLVYIDFLEVAPWNWTVPEIGQAQRYAMVGARLFERAVAQSKAEGLGGRVGLHALPQSESFYSGACGMTPLGCDEAFEDLMYFELSRENADTILKWSV